MSYADKVFVENAIDILENGTDTQGQAVRPHWPDGTPAYTIKRFGIVNRYDLRKEFPAITLRKTGIKSAFDEILWIYQRKSNNIHDLKPHIWDEWADSEGLIGKAYGYQVAKPFVYKEIKTPYKEENYNEDYGMDIPLPEWPKEFDKFTKRRGFVNVPDPNDRVKESYISDQILMDQMDAVLYDLKHQPFSRRILTDIWNFQDLHDMGLQPCCWSCTFNVTDEGGDKLVLNMILNQRSNDFLAANNWNVVQYALLLMMVAQVSDMIPGELVHVIADQHIYDRHVDIVKEIIQRPQYDAPIVTLDPDIKDFYKFTYDSINIENYKTNEQVRDIPIAI